MNKELPPWFFLCVFFVFGCASVFFHNKTPDREAADKGREYFVPDPAAMNEGGIKWLRFQNLEHVNRSGNYVIYEVNGEIYQTPLFVEKELNQTPPIKKP